MTAIDIADPAQDIPRDRYGRPIVTPPAGGKPEPYTRCTTFVDCLEDKFNLQKWMQRMVAIGLADRADLLLAVAAHKDDKTKLDRICEDAREAAAASASATTGTALHALAEQYDRGQLTDLSRLPGTARADLQAYIAATNDFRHLHIERFTVHDGFKVGGTPDRISGWTDGTYIADIKTGSVDFGGLKIAMQLAMYSRSVIYDHVTKQRTPLPDVNRDRGIVIHLPAGEATCRLLWVDLAAGWEAVQVARAVRNWRTRKNLLSEIAATVLEPVAADPLAPSLLDRIATATSSDDLTVLWRSHVGEWTDVHTQAAAERKRQIEQGAAA